MVEYSETDPKPEIEDSCKVECLKLLHTYKACTERIKDDKDAHCVGQYFDYWACIDKCASPRLFARLK